MVLRWVALAIALATLAIVGIFLSAVVWPPADSGAAAPISAAKQISDSAGSWKLSAEVIPGSTGMVAVSVSVTDTEGRPIAPPAQPTALLRMTGMAVGTESVPLLQDRSGSWRGSGKITMGGRWSLRVQVGDEVLDLPFEATLR